MSTRRSLLGAAAAALAVSSGAIGTTTASAAPDADADLLRLGAEFRRLQLQYLKLHADNEDDDGDLPDEVRAEIHDIVPRQHDLAGQIADLRATTLAGLRVKAAVLLSYSAYDSDGDPIWDNHDGLLGWSLARDLCGDAAARPDGAFT
jgi:hypothetical protein